MQQLKVEEKNSPVAFGLPRSEVTTDTEKEDFFFVQSEISTKSVLLSTKERVFLLVFLFSR